MIVVGVDGSDPSKRALRWAANQAKLTGAKLKVVTSWEYPPTLGWAPPYPSDFDPNEDARTALQETIEAVLGPEAALVGETEVTEGHPAFVLTEAARGAELLVVGSRGHGAFAGMVLGSVSEYCAAHAPCPVVVVRHSDDKS
jgi:nucleotide-binding universal stress UspA family protein